MFKPIIVIPFFNHGLAFEKIAPNLKQINLPVLVVDDGSSFGDAHLLKRLCAKYHFKHIRNPKNGGKGAAVKIGINWAILNGFTHLLQIDADGQHDLNDIPEFLNLAQKHSNTIIVGQPIYDLSVPKARFYGRKITNFWVYLETLGKLKADTMCGFRIYPLLKIQKILPIVWFNRMGFDVEILVKSFLNKLSIMKKNTKVIYQKEGISHFRPFKDNIEISCVHTCLCVYSIWKIFTRWIHK